MNAWSERRWAGYATAASASPLYRSLPPESMAQVTLDNVSKTYAGAAAHAVRNISLDIGDGEFVVLVGPSGCGKTTTLRMIAGLEDIDAGHIRIGGRVVNDVHPRDRDIAMVFQNYALYPHMTVAQNLGFALKMRKVPKAEIARRVAQAAATLGIEDLLDRKPRQLSGGQRQRVAVGRAIVREPQAFLFDEPLSNLDAKLRLATRAELKSLHQRLKTTTIYVTHDQEEAMTLGDRIVVMSKGLIQQVGPPLGVYRRPANRFVAAFIGSPPMNFIPGRLSAERGEMAFIEDLTEPGGAPIRLRVPSTSLASHSGKPVILGLRPQAIHVGPPAGPFEFRIRVIEPLGDTIDIHGTTAAGSSIVGRIPASQPVATGQSARFGFDLDSIHLFEPGEFGVSLLG